VEFLRTAGCVGVAILLGGASDIEGSDPVATTDLPAVVVRVDNGVGLLPGHLRLAEARASEVFARIGAAIHWIDEEESASQHITPSFTVVLVNAEGQGKEVSRFADALGLAHPSVRRAYVFYDRVAALSVGTPRTIPSLLGDIIAHEIGHLMLPPPGHSAGGIMRPELETKSWYVQTFTKPQAREVLGRVRALH